MEVGNLNSYETPCAVCNTTPASSHFGVNACRPCAAFFRRSIVLKKKYKCKYGQKCKFTSNRKMCGYCRFERCYAVGMEASKIRYAYDKHGPKLPKKPSDSLTNSPSVSTESEVSSEELFNNVVAGYSKFIADTKLYYFASNPERLLDKEVTFVQCTLEQHTRVSKSLIVYCLDMLNNFYQPFNEFADEAKKKVLHEYHLFFTLLSQNFLNTLYFLNEPNKMFLHFGSYVDVTHFENFFYTSSQLELCNFSTFNDTNVKFIKVCKKFCKIQPDQAEIAVMAGIYFWREVNNLYPSLQYESYTEKLQTELTRHCRQKYGELTYSVRMCKVLSLMRDLEELMLFLSETMAIGTFMYDNWDGRHQELFT
ncbi:unnamed protein product [Bursaphelenchus okinawaensis]|uniref:Nuclear receptor domain-containing protein n=1 Tax=Bursaphelenchus okinawaensis TaxID=465554 RepID=A0A811JS26_9BILA|nr:unnamed protein product [Bursaphelenchus okinawaensis]CAG9080296.1 unnamed protein product [Bursaphelenchus okinawaensis]